MNSTQNKNSAQGVAAMQPTGTARHSLQNAITMQGKQGNRLPQDATAVKDNGAARLFVLIAAFAIMLAMTIGTTAVQPTAAYAEESAGNAPGIVLPSSVYASGTCDAAGENGTCSWFISKVNESGYSVGQLVVYPTDGISGTVAISTNAPWVACKNDIKSVSFAPGVSATTLAYAFKNFRSLQSVDFTNLDTSAVTRMEGLCLACDSLTNVNFGGMDTSSVRALSEAFSQCDALTGIDFTGLDLSDVSNTRRMFTDSLGLKTIVMGGLNSTRTVDTNEMFAGCIQLENLDLSGFSTGLVADMCYMFTDCAKLTELDLSGMTTAPATKKSYMLRDCKGLTKVITGPNWATDGIDLYTDCAWFKDGDYSKTVIALSAGPGTYTQHHYVEFATQPTCTQPGITGMACQRCKKAQPGSNTTVVDKLGHSYSDETAYIAPTCTEAGGIKHACTRTDCGHFYLSDEEPALGHAYNVEWRDPQTPCTQCASWYHQCTRCGEEGIARTEDAAPGHDEPSAPVYTEPTCTEDGGWYYPCARCGNKRAASTEVATGHRYDDVLKVKKATATADGYAKSICSVCGEASTRIIPKAVVSLSATSFTYNGKAQRPAVTVTANGAPLEPDCDYTVNFSAGRKNVGSYKVTVKGAGDEYAYTVSKTFTIVPKGTKVKSLTASKKAFTVKWSKQGTQATGYQIRYATNPAMTGAKTVTIAKTGTTSKKIAKLSPKKTYYVQVRTYKTVSGTKYCSAWSPVSPKSVTVK